jgi:hypothetical protein
MDLSAGASIAQIQGVAAVAVDCLPNMDAASVADKTAPLVRQLRSSFGDDVAIVLAKATP